LVVAVFTALTVGLPAPSAAQPGATQLFLAPTGRALAQGQLYVKGLAVSSPMVQVGVTDRFSVGAATPLIAAGRFAALTPKFQVVRTETSSTALGVVQFVGLGASGAGLGYVAHTVELKDGAVHVAVLAPYGRNGFRGRPGFMFGAERRLNPRATFITENYWLGSIPMVSAGVRFERRQVTWDLGWAQVLSARGIFGGPIINAGWKF
jgi:hypothetical protein